MWQKRLTFASHKVIIKNAADVHQQAPNIAEANKYTATVGDVPFTVTFPTPLQCRGNTPIGFSSDVIFGTDTDYLSTINVYTGTYDFDPKDVGVFGLRHRFSTIVSYSGTTETNASYMNVTYVQVKVEPASYVHASQNPAACPETIYPAYLTSASQSNTLFIFGAAVVDSATGDYVVFGRLWTQVFGSHEEFPVILARNRNHEQHYLLQIRDYAAPYERDFTALQADTSFDNIYFAWQTDCFYDSCGHIGGIIAKVAHPTGEFKEAAQFSPYTNQALGGAILWRIIIYADGLTNPIYTMGFLAKTYPEIDLNYGSWNNIIANLDADLNLQWVRYIDPSSSNAITGIVSGVFFKPSPAHADGPHLLAVFGFQSEAFERHLVAVKASDGSATGYFPTPAIHAFVGPDVQDTDVLETSLDGNFFYYLTRYHPIASTWRLQIQKYNKNFAQAALGSYIVNTSVFSGIVSAAIEEFADGATVGVAGREFHTGTYVQFCAFRASDLVVLFCKYNYDAKRTTSAVLEKGYGGKLIGFFGTDNANMLTKIIAFDNQQLQTCDNCDCFAHEDTLTTNSSPFLWTFTTTIPGYKTKYFTAADYGDLYQHSLGEATILDKRATRIQPGNYADHTGAFCYSVSKPTVPQITNKSWPVNNFPSSQTVSTTFPTQCQNYPVTVQYLKQDDTSLPTGISYDALNDEWIVTTVDNTYAGTFPVMAKATTTHPYQTNRITEMDFQIQVVANNAPTWQATPASFYTEAYWDITHTFTKLTDVEGDIPMMSLKLYDNTMTEITPTWWAVTQVNINSIKFTVTNPPQAASGAYTIIAEIWDVYNVVATPTSAIIPFTVAQNFSPREIVGNPLPNPVGGVIPEPFAFSFTASDYFQDVENDDILITVTYASGGAPDTNWLSFSYVGGVVVVTGTPPADNAYAVTYSITFHVEDQFDDPPTDVVRSFTYTQNLQPVTGTPADAEFRWPDSRSFDFSDSSYHSDPENLSYTISIKVNGTDISNPLLSEFITWDPVTYILDVFPTRNEHCGGHTFSITFDDGISVPVTETWLINLLFNLPLVAINSIPNMSVIVGNVDVSVYDKMLYFEDPESMPFTTLWRQSGSSYVLYFMSWNGATYELSIDPLIINVGLYAMEYVGIDDSGQETVISLQVEVKPCNYRCKSCWGQDFTSCYSCQKNNFLYGTSCLETCPTGYFADSSAWWCSVCHQFCKICEDGTQFKCSKCNDGYFYYENGCYDVCPKGRYGDTLTKKCEACHFSCTDCFGGSGKECYACLPKQFILFPPECKKPTCQVDQFFDWTAEKCVNCHKNCKTCVERDFDDCIKCNIGEILARNTPESKTDYSGYCYPCESIPGYFTNENYRCQEICGDGVKKDVGCDDGNLKDGDGCSKDCVVEYGFACKENSVGLSSCVESIQPEMSIQNIFEDNRFIFQFSEFVIVNWNETFSTDNMIIEVTGPNGPYDFEAIAYPVGKQGTSFKVGEKISSFELGFKKFHSKLDGGDIELLQIHFRNESSIIDLVGNKYKKVKIGGYLFENDYMDSQTEARVNGGGQSMQYSFMTVVVINILLKVFLQASMGAMWGAVHALQIFHLMLHMDFKFPQNLIAFGGYLGVAQGNLEELEKFVPDLAEYALDSQDMDELRYYMPRSFKRMKVSTPFFIRAYGTSFTIVLFTVFITLPGLFILNKICSQIKFFQDFIKSFFFNAPMRGLVELYLEVSFVVFLNFRNIFFMTFTQSFAMFTAFCAGSVLLYFPFFSMSVLWAYRDYIQTKGFVDTWGMLTDDIHTRYMMQINYYPLFIYQRFYFCFVVVFGLDYPTVSVFAIAFGCILMGVYLIINKPFKLEKQQTTAVIDEFVVAISVLIFLVFQQDISLTTRGRVGWIIIAIIGGATIKNLLIALYYGYLELKQTAYFRFAASDEKSDSPATSEMFDERPPVTSSSIRSFVNRIRERKQAGLNPMLTTEQTPQDIQLRAEIAKEEEALGLNRVIKVEVDDTPYKKFDMLKPTGKFAKPNPFEHPIRMTENFEPYEPKTQVKKKRKKKKKGSMSKKEKEEFQKKHFVSGFID